MKYSKSKLAEGGWAIYEAVDTGQRLVAVVPDELIDNLLDTLNGGAFLNAQDRKDAEALADYVSDDREREDFLDNAELSENEYDRLDNAPDEDTVIWQLVCGRPSNDHAYARAWRLRRALSGLPHGEVKEEQCNECGALIPQVSDGSLTSSFHETSCPHFKEE